ncbi:MAG: hypothetical protein HGJ94_04375 [Desulfosarcina sp.]|nr:hypothetical protein [Desulfosarcina sp.]MBC2743343.1 hypothetical protein [Desulfosarcina sp.]MBC2766253.1 hypothetical protein [Desulfosarcina sp.]
MKRFVHLFGILVLGALLAIIAACQDDVPKSQSAAPEQKESQMAQESTEAEKGGSPQLASGALEIVGTVVTAGNEILITTDEGDYAVSSQPIVGNLKGMAGKTVKVTATLVTGVEREDGYRVIDVIEITEIE